MYTLYHTVGCLLDRGVYHTRNDGKLVRQLTRENADFVHSVNRRVGKDSHYFYIFEYKKGDIIEIEEVDGKKWYTTLNDISEMDLSSWHYYLNSICNKLVEQNKPLPINLDNLFKDLLPALVEYMKRAKDYRNRRLYIDEYSWMVRLLGKKLTDYVSKEHIESYLSTLIYGYDLASFEEYMDRKEVEIDEELIVAYKEAKAKVAETIESAKKLIENRKFNEIRFEEFSAHPNLTIKAYDTSCGDVWIYITYSSWKGISVKLAIEMPKLKWWTNIIDITEECKEFAKLYESREWYE